MVEGERANLYTSFWLRLKARFASSRWYERVDGILLQNGVIREMTRAWAQSAQSLARPAEIFYNTVTEEFCRFHASGAAGVDVAVDNTVDPAAASSSSSSSASASGAAGAVEAVGAQRAGGRGGLWAQQAFLEAVRERLGPAWDPRLGPLARAYYVTAWAVTGAVGAGRFMGGAVQLCRQTVHGVMDDLLSTWDRVLGATEKLVDTYLPDRTPAAPAIAQHPRLHGAGAGAGAGVEGMDEGEGVGVGGEARRAADALAAAAAADDEADADSAGKEGAPRYGSFGPRGRPGMGAGVGMGMGYGGQGYGGMGAGADAGGLGGGLGGGYARVPSSASLAALARASEVAALAAAARAEDARASRGSSSGSSRSSASTFYGRGGWGGPAASTLPATDADPGASGGLAVADLRYRHAAAAAAAAAAAQAPGQQAQGLFGQGYGFEAVVGDGLEGEAEGQEGAFESGEGDEDGDEGFLSEDDEDGDGEGDVDVDVDGDEYHPYPGGEGRMGDGGGEGTHGPYGTRVSAAHRVWTDKEPGAGSVDGVEAVAAAAGAIARHARELWMQHQQREAAGGGGSSGGSGGSGSAAAGSGLPSLSYLSPQFQSPGGAGGTGGVSAGRYPRAAQSAYALRGLQQQQQQQQQQRRAGAPYSRVTDDSELSGRYGSREGLQGRTLRELQTVRREQEMFEDLAAGEIANVYTGRAAAAAVAAAATTATTAAAAAPASAGSPGMGPAGAASRGLLATPEAGPAPTSTSRTPGYPPAAAAEPRSAASVARKLRSRLLQRVQGLNSAVQAVQERTAALSMTALSEGVKSGLPADWFATVDDILLQSAFMRALASVRRPAEHFFATCVDAFAASRWLTSQDFAHVLSRKLGTSWDPRLLAPLEALLQSARGLAGVTPAGGPGAAGADGGDDAAMLGYDDAAGIPIDAELSALTYAHGQAPGPLPGVGRDDSVRGNAS